MKFYTSWVDPANRNINFVTEMFTSGTLRQYRLKHKKLNISAVKNWCRQILRTPEFMAPEVYEEEYNELVDIYSFGMCVLEMVTFEYPYNECTHPAEIYKKVVSGKKPEALYKVNDPEVRQFVEKCLANVSVRLTARELLNDPFLLEINDDRVAGFGPLEYLTDEPVPFVEQPFYGKHQEISIVSFQNPTVEFDLFTSQEDEPLRDVGVPFNGTKRDDDGVFLRLRIADKEGRIRNIYFPFDIDNDTASNVATEMISELDLTDENPTKIAELIDDQIANLVPDWKQRQRHRIAEIPSTIIFCQNCTSHAHLTDHQSSNGHGPGNLEVLKHSGQGCTSVHGRFEEITYQVNGQEHCLNVGLPCRADSYHFTDMWGQRDHEQNFSKEERIINIDYEKPFSISSAEGLLDDHENDIRQELGWLKAKYQIQLNEIREKKIKRSVMLESNRDATDQHHNYKFPLPPTIPKLRKSVSFGSTHTLYTPLDSVMKCKSLMNQECCETSSGSCSPEPLFTAKSFYSLYRTTSLPVDAVDV
ncbi:hypothetical protein ACFE04_015342 [Oxalis oulophora]